MSKFLILSGIRLMITICGIYLILGSSGWETLMGVFALMWANNNWVDKSKPMDADGFFLRFQSHRDRKGGG